MQTILTVVPRNNFTEQAAIAKLAAEGKLRLAWHDKRRVIQIKAPRPINAPVRPDSEPEAA